MIIRNGPFPFPALWSWRPLAIRRQNTQSQLCSSFHDPRANSKQNMAVMASNGRSPHSPSLRLGLPAPQPSRRHHARSLLGPSFHDPRTHYILESHTERAAPLSRRDNERQHAVGSHSVLALRLHLVACNPSSSCRFWDLDHLCSNLSQLFHFCWITEIRSLNLCVCFYPLLFCLCFSDRNELQL